jgi:hypothetical protein
MPSDNEKNREFGSQSTDNQDPRRADTRRPFEDDTEEAFRLPKPTPEVSQDDDDAGADEKRADSAIDDLEIEVDEDELKAESESPGRKY